MVNYLLVPESELTNRQKSSIDKLEKECFSEVDPKEAEECFYAESFARILAYSENELVGHLSLFRRIIEFDGGRVVLGGAAGACVTQHMRGKDIATTMMRKGIAILKRRKCDVACLNVDLSKNVYRLYEKLGFQLMNRQISFEDTYGKIRYDNGTMFTPICSKEIYNHIMNSDKTFHYGKGYW